MKRAVWFLIPCFAVLALLTSCARPELPVLGRLPGFQLTDQESRKISLEDLKGKVWVANFIFTSCAHTCPLLTQRMKGVQARFLEWRQEKPDLPLRIVSFSVDPERDSPEALAKYAKRYGADPALWRFVTGPMDQVQNTVVHGFKISMGKVPLEGAIAAGPGDIFDVLHGEKFVLVDQKGRIRGYYASEDGREIRRLFNDLQNLLARPAS